jgi:hypothetical protein
MLIGVGINGNLKPGGSAAARAVQDPPSPFVLKPGVAVVPNMVAPRKWTGEEGVEVENAMGGK